MQRMHKLEFTLDTEFGRLLFSDSEIQSINDYRPPAGIIFQTKSYPRSSQSAPNNYVTDDDIICLCEARAGQYMRYRKGDPVTNEPVAYTKLYVCETDGMLKMCRFVEKRGALALVIVAPYVSGHVQILMSQLFEAISVSDANERPLKRHDSGLSQRSGDDPDRV